MLAYTDMFMLWKPRSLAEVTPESLAFLEIIKPAPEVRVGCEVGCEPGCELGFGMGHMTWVHMGDGGCI